MKFETMLKATLRWEPDRNTTEGVVLGSIVRMVRNLNNFCFFIKTYPFGTKVQQHAAYTKSSNNIFNKKQL